MSQALENLRVVLVATRNPLNIGAVARAMSNFGAPHLRVVNPYEKAWRDAVSAVGASAVMRDAEQFTSVADAVADCALVVGTTAVGHRELQHPLRTLAQGAPLLRKRMARGKVALLFGSEKWGLSNDSLSHCHWLMHIPTRVEHQSMNLGQSVAVCLYELRRMQAAPAGERPGKRGAAKMETVERITQTLLETLHSSGYTGKRPNELAEEKLRRMIRRFALEEADAEVFLGMLKKTALALERLEKNAKTRE